MTVYRITLAIWADQLVASGRAARWNTNGSFMIYSAANRALACLENIVHRGRIGSNESFRTVEIEIPAHLAITEILKEDLPADWRDYTSYPISQALGDQWLHSNAGAVLKVPSAIIIDEFNYLINPQHSDFTSIKIKSILNFTFDGRL